MFIQETRVWPFLLRDPINILVYLTILARQNHGEMKAKLLIVFKVGSGRGAEALYSRRWRDVTASDAIVTGRPGGGRGFSPWCLGS